MTWAGLVLVGNMVVDHFLSWIRMQEGKIEKWGGYSKLNET